MDLSWDEFEPFFQDLNDRSMNGGNIADRTSRIDLVSEIQARLTMKVTRDVLPTILRGALPGRHSQPAGFIQDRNSKVRFRFSGV